MTKKQASPAAPAPGMPPKKIDKLRALMAAGDWRKALSLAASWPDLGEHRDAIKTAASAQLSPLLYAGMGKDPAVLAADGRIALIERYGAPCSLCGAWVGPGKDCCRR